MEKGSNKSLFTLVAVVIFGIFLSLSYWLFSDEMKSVLADVMDNAADSTSQQISNTTYIGANLLLGGGKVVEGPLVGGSNGGQPNTDGVDGHEFIQYKDLAPIFDEFGLGRYTISFDMKTTRTGSVLVYMQNGETHKYSFGARVDSTTEWERYSVTVNVTLTTGKYSHPTKSILAFYGTYNTQVSPSVRNVKIQMGDVDSGEIPVYVDAPSTLTY